MEVGEVGVDDRGPRAIQLDALFIVPSGRAMDVAAVEHKVGSGGEGDEIVLGRAGVGEGSGDLHTDNAVMVCAGRRRECGRRVGGHDLRHECGLRRGDAGARRGKTREGRGLNVDPAGRRFGGKREVANVGGSSLEHDDAARSRRIEGRLKITPGRDVDHRAGGRHIGRV